MKVSEQTYDPQAAALGNQDIIVQEPAAPQLDLTTPPAGKNRRGVWVWGTALAYAVIAATVMFILIVAVDDKKQSTVDQTSSRLNALASEKAKVVDAWFRRFSALGERFADSDFIRIFVFENTLAAIDPALADTIAEQQPYVQNVVDRFSASDELLGVALIDSNGLPIAISQDHAEHTGLSDIDLKILWQKFDEQSPNAGAIEDASLQQQSTPPVMARNHKDNLVVDIAVPILAPQSFGEGINGQTIGAMIMSVDANSGMAGVLELSLISQEGERHWLLIPAGLGGQPSAGTGQLINNSASVLHFDQRAEIRPVSNDLALPVSLETYTSFDGRTVFAASTRAAYVPWIVVSEIDSAVALQPVANYRNAAWVISIAALMILALTFVTIWWRQNSLHDRAMARQYHQLASKIYEHKILLESITSAIPDFIWLKRTNGEIIWANKSFARLSRFVPDQDYSTTERDVFGASIVPVMAAGDRSAIETGLARIDEQSMMLQGEERIVNLTKVPVAGDTNDVVGVVGVARDVTLTVQQRRKKERLIRQTVQALVRSVELVDTYLVGHTNRLQNLCLAIAERLDCTADDKVTLELAAGLSQVGKSFIAKEIVAKPERHTENEARIMQDHIRHAVSVVEHVDFELPVVETLAQMHERLDGTGYPNGLEGQKISFLARIMAVADVYCARTSPRSYRQFVAPQEVILQLQANSNRYDQSVVATLNTLVVEKHPCALVIEPEKSEQSDNATLDTVPSAAG